MIIALSVAYDEGTFAVHYAGAPSLASANKWLDEREANMKQQGIACARAVLNTDHVKLIDECEVDEPHS